MISDFDNTQVAAYAKDIFDACSKHIQISKDGVSAKESDLEKILSFSKDYISNIEYRDLKFLLIQPRLGELFNSEIKYSQKELERKLSDLFEFCS